MKMLTKSIISLMMLIFLFAPAVPAFAGDKDFQLIRHGVIPLLGAAGNIALAVAVLSVGIAAGGAAAQSTYIGLALAGGWLMLSVIYIGIWQRRKGQVALPSHPD